MSRKWIFLATLTTSLTGPQALAYSQAHCQAVSDRALANNVKVMVIGVEGLAQMDAGSINQLNNYSETAKGGGAVNIPKGPYNPGFVIAQAGVTRGLLTPLMRKYGTKVEPIVVGQESIGLGSNSVGQICAEIWMKVPGRKLIIAGHSYGGPAAIDLAKNINARGIKVDALYTIDAVERSATNPMSKPANIGYLANYRQGGVNPGAALSFAQRDKLLGGVGHMSIPGHPAILGDLEGKIAGYLKEKDAKPKVKTDGPQKAIAAGVAVLTGDAAPAQRPCPADVISEPSPEPTPAPATPLKRSRERSR